MICFAFIPITYLFYPETANRTLEDIDRFFETQPSIIVCRNRLATQLQRPEQYIEADERIAKEEMQFREKGVQHVEAKV